MLLVSLYWEVCVGGVCVCLLLWILSKSATENKKRCSNQPLPSNHHQDELSIPTQKNQK